ncbi:TPA: hypothetical protein HA234_06875 [Candidatus Woesearchaeota archaeon]|nr:hypothetical protein [Candidatus Woesearchaeota archaeon]
MVSWYRDWAELLMLVLIALGFVLSVLLQNASFSYTTILLAGFLAGRIYYLKRFTEPILPFILMIVGFLVGYLIGNFWVSRIWIVILFMLGLGFSYYLHLKKIIVIFKSENFFK